MPPVPELLPLSVSAPLPVLFTKASKVTFPATVREAGAVVASTFHVCEADRVGSAMTGALMVIAPACAATEMPPEGLAGFSVSMLAAPPVPELMLTAVTVVGLCVN